MRHYPIAKKSKSSYEIVKFSLPWGGSAIIDSKIRLPQDRTLKDIDNGIPVTYVPARNIIFLSIAVSWAEILDAEYIYIGAHSYDFSGYPDCRRSFFESFQKVIDVATKSGVKGKKIKIVTPILNKTKSEIVKLGKELKVPFELTWSCYKGGKKPCQRCDSCILRKKGFDEAGVIDPLLR